MDIKLIDSRPLIGRLDVLWRVIDGEHCMTIKGPGNIDEASYRVAPEEAYEAFLHPWRKYHKGRAAEDHEAWAFSLRV